MGTYRVYGSNGLEAFDEYVKADGAQDAANTARGWHDGDEHYQVLEVARVVWSWK